MLDRLIKNARIVDGTGMPAYYSHVGIRNVRNRLENMVGGSLHITSSANGTVVVVTIPVKESRSR